MRRLLTLLSLLLFSAFTSAAERPNILWITCEDISCQVGCYGDDYAVTPNIDQLAQEGIRYTHAVAPIGVCAPARSCLITGMYPNSIGTQHMRCQGNLPDFVKGYPHYLREAGYYCTNNSKTDYNFGRPRPAQMWDQSSNQAHWRNRKNKDQPFFAIFNYTSCHESQIRLPEAQYQRRIANFSPDEIHDPDKAEVPPYHPNTPETRKDWARYADMITFMDKQVGDILKQLDDDGLAEDTIVFFYSDHGAGMPRSKRWLYDSSMIVPFVIRFPEKWKKLAPSEPGSVSDRLVSFVDLGPTALSLAGVKIPDHMQGEAFLGDQAREPRKYLHGYRDRMDERIDLIRCVRDHKYKYIRNYHPELPYFHHQHISYMYQMPTMQVWQRLADEGKLEGPQAVFMSKTKPTEELYDCEADPHEINNLADSPEHQEILVRLRQEHRNWMKQIVDVGLLPEADLRSRFGQTPPYDAVRDNPESYPFDRIAAAADLANARDPKNLDRLQQLFKDSDPAVRYWAAVGIGSLFEKGIDGEAALKEQLQDPSPTVRVAVADALCRIGQPKLALTTLTDAMDDPNEWVRLAAINVLDRLDGLAMPAKQKIEAARKDSNGYVQRVAEHALKGLQGG